jgi:hypothetical protein
MKYKIRPIINKKISFDFDGTLTDDFDGSLNELKDEIQSILKQYKQLGNDVYIVTKRFSPSNSSLGKVNEHIDVLKVASELEISGKNIIFTNRNLKAEKLIELGIDIHFENGDYELHYLNSFKHNINVVMITEPYWRDIVY